MAVHVPVSALGLSVVSSPSPFCLGIASSEKPPLTVAPFGHLCFPCVTSVPLAAAGLFVILIPLDQTLLDPEAISLRTQEMSKKSTQ